MTHNNKAIIESMLSAMRVGDVDGYVKSLDENVTATIIGSTPVSGVFHGRADLLERGFSKLTSHFSGKNSLTVDRITAEGDYVVVQSRNSVPLLNGKVHNNTHCIVYGLKNGRIVTFEQYFDTDLLMKTFGF